MKDSKALKIQIQKNIWFEMWEVSSYKLNKPQIWPSLDQTISQTVQGEVGYVQMFKQGLMRQRQMLPTWCMPKSNENNYSNCPLTPKRQMKNRKILQSPSEYWLRRAKDNTKNLQTPLIAKIHSSWDVPPKINAHMLLRISERNKK